MQGYGCAFEGTEKKLELIVSPEVPSLRGLGHPYWTRIVRHVGADVISRIHNDYCDAYLLSESSLFVFDHKIVLLTCGRTTLHEAVPIILEQVPADHVRMLTYQRKNEVFPHAQPTSFFDDTTQLNEHLPGRAFRFGHEDGHHMYLYHLDRAHSLGAGETTLEILMYGIDPVISCRFSRETQPSTDAVRRQTNVHRLLPGFAVDDHLFEPTGYSLNALAGDEYYTVHVTPENPGSYASFETNHRCGAGLADLVARVTDCFRPRAFDVVQFVGEQGPGLALPGYEPTEDSARRLELGHVRFRSFQRPSDGVADAVELALPVAAYSGS